MRVGGPESNSRRNGSRSDSSAAASAARALQPSRWPSRSSRPSRGWTGRGTAAWPSAVSAAPSSRSSCSSRRSDCPTASSEGASSHGNFRTSGSPRAASCSTAPHRSTRLISGTVCSGRPRWLGSSQRRTHTPGAVRPARPARWSAEAREIGTSRKRSMPTDGSNSICRARPQSTTAVTPSTVTDVSATFVARTTFRRSVRWSARSCCSGGRSPCSGSTVIPCSRAKASSSSAVWRISRRPGRNASTSPARSLSTSRTASATARDTGVSLRRGRYTTSTGKVRPALSTTGHPPKYADTAAGSTVADMTTACNSGRTFSRISRTIPSARSASRPRSWNSSKTTHATPSRYGSSCNRRSRTPGVITRTRVRALALRSNRTW
ncbi:hypothetical protein FTUN_0973 [Frigoriglobus tundricola]|uniref:Uncharacterized protein n=1 Tax=Frigoriglobus tundricola TaxID=2774151 RepID=A0A6M5YHE6_9BACT|nr:hypothetical protein FTUN_0973 [Frigoriglobus tundricola]